MGRPLVAAGAVLAATMMVQAGLGLLFQDQYRDVEWIKATWLGNDWVTLVLALPLLAAGLTLARRGSVRGRLLVMGALGYGIYNYAFYLFGAALNVFFPIYVAAFVVSAVGLILGLAASRVEGRLRLEHPGRERLIGGYLVFVACGLSAVWFLMWAAYAFAGRPTPVEPEAFKLVAALDLSLMVPALASGGVLLWRGRPWGFLIAAIAGIQGTLYLVVLSVNSAVAIAKGFAEAPGELPLWGLLAIATAAATVALLGGLREGAAPRG